MNPSLSRSEAISAALAPLWAAWPLEAALERRVVREGMARTAAAALLETRVAQGPIARPPAFIDPMAAVAPGNPAELVALQRLEWAALFAWCAARAAGLE